MLAIMKVEDGRVAKFASFDTKGEATAHVAKFAEDYPDAFVHADVSGNILDYRVEKGRLVLDARPDHRNTRDQIVRRLKFDQEFRALAVAFRDSRNLTTEQMVDLLASKAGEPVDA